MNNILHHSKDIFNVNIKKIRKHYAFELFYI